MASVNLLGKLENINYLWGEIDRGNCRLKGEVPTLSHFLFWYILLIIGTMKEIKLTRGLVALVDDEDYEFLSQRHWYAAKRKKTYYARTDKMVNWKTTKTYMHRLILNTPKGMQTDHIDHNGLNNQRHNIRICTNTQNRRNVSSHGRSKYLGVSFNGKHIRAQITIGDKYIHLGYFKTEEDAARAHDIKAKELFGEFANLNFKVA